MTKYSIIRAASVQEVDAINRPLARSLPSKVVDAIGATRLTCEEAGCEAFEHGWVMPIDTSSDLGMKQAHYIEHEAGRQYVKVPGPDASKYLPGVEYPPAVTVYLFPPGQRYCFKVHEDREVLFVREKRGAQYVHTNPLDFNEDWNESAYKIQRIRERG